MASKVAIPEYAPTPVEEIPAVARRVRQTFRTHKTKDVEWRLVQLRKLYWALTDLTAEMTEALHRDLRKSPYESALTEVDFLKGACMVMIDNLKTFARDEKLGAPAVPLSFAMMGLRVRKEPVGAVLVIGAFNYPFQLLLGPVIGAIGAGCTVVAKPSEMAPASAAVTAQILGRLDPDAFAVVNGAVPETTALLDEKWDKILYTGSAQVGAIVAKRAAETLTPVCLELGGRNPAFVTANADLALAARRLLWGKAHNAGQVCISQNYILIDKAAVEPFIGHLKAALADFFPAGAKASPDMSRIVNERHFRRIKKMLDGTRGRIVMGGAVDEAELFIEPTAVVVDSMDDPVIQEESFGPILPIFPVNTLDEALIVANRVHRTPLALFSFGSKAENARVLNEMTSGGASLNDSFLHGSLHSVPFGGVGDSGWGSYRGKAGFDVFSHARTVSETPAWAERLLRVRYMPYDWRQLRLYQRISSPAPNFDRSGRVVRRGLAYWASLLLGLGAGGVKGAFLRWLLVAAAYYAAAWKKGWL